MKREWMIERRKKRGLTQTELAEKCGVSSQTISNIENGYRVPSGKLAFRIAKELEFDMQLFYENEIA